MLVRIISTHNRLSWYRTGQTGNIFEVEPYVGDLAQVRECYQVVSGSWMGWLIDAKDTEPVQTLEILECERMKWSLETFEKATKESSLIKLKGEIVEVEQDLINGDDPTEEYVDCLMCLFDSAGRAGINAQQLTEAFALKLKKNKARSWVRNPDDTYSHVKQSSNESI